MFLGFQKKKTKLLLSHFPIGLFFYQYHFSQEKICIGFAPFRMKLAVMKAYDNLKWTCSNKTDSYLPIFIYRFTDYLECLFLSNQKNNMLYVTYIENREELIYLKSAKKLKWDKEKNRSPLNLYTTHVHAYSLHNSF